MTTFSKLSGTKRAPVLRPRGTEHEHRPTGTVAEGAPQYCWSDQESSLPAGRADSVARFWRRYGKVYDNILFVSDVRVLEAYRHQASFREGVSPAAARLWKRYSRFHENFLFDPDKQELEACSSQVPASPGATLTDNECTKKAVPKSGSFSSGAKTEESGMSRFDNPVFSSTSPVSASRLLTDVLACCATLDEYYVGAQKTTKSSAVTDGLLPAVIRLAHAVCGFDPRDRQGKSLILPGKEGLEQEQLLETLAIVLRKLEAAAHRSFASECLGYGSANGKLPGLPNADESIRDHDDDATWWQRLLGAARPVADKMLHSCKSIPVQIAYSIGRAVKSTAQLCSATLRKAKGMLSGRPMKAAGFYWMRIGPLILTNLQLIFFGHSMFAPVALLAFSEDNI